MRLKKTALILASAGLAAVLLAGCSGGADKGNEIRMVDGRLTEQKLLVRMGKLLIEDNTDLTVNLKDEMTAVNAYNEITADNADMMVSYDGTVLTTFLHLDPADVPEGTALYDYANQQVGEKSGLKMLDKLGINNTYTIAVTKEVKEKYGLETITDLAAVSGELVFGAEHEFFAEDGSAKFKPFTEFYGIQFKESRPVDLNLKYSAVSSQNLDCTVVYATDGLNRKAGLQILKDDRKYFPEYNGAFLIRNDLEERLGDQAQKLEDSLNMLSGVFTDEIMTDLTYRVDVEGEKVDDVARDFLVSGGYLKE